MLLSENILNFFMWIYIAEHEFNIAADARAEDNWLPFLTHVV